MKMDFTCKLPMECSNQGSRFTFWSHFLSFVVC